MLGQLGDEYSELEECRGESVGRACSDIYKESPSRKGYPASTCQRVASVQTTYVVRYEHTQVQVRTVAFAMPRVPEFKQNTMARRLNQKSRFHLELNPQLQVRLCGALKLNFERASRYTKDL